MGNRGLHDGRGLISVEWRSRIVLKKGDITEAETDAIVNAANNDLILGGGVAGAIRKKGGSKIQEECSRIGPIKVGEAAITSGGNLKARFVIHAASMQLGGRTTEESLRSATRNSLKIASERQLKTVAFPAIGTGIAGFPMARCAEVMLAEIRDHLRTHPYPEQIQLVLYDDSALKEFQRALESMAD